jgi:glycerol-3-phosphate dehydrogenase
MTLRNNQILRLESEEFEVLIIGGGINGSVAAAALSARGIKTALIDRKDFGGETSQSSSNLIWGGIKYLEGLEFGLVRQLCRSRNQLIRAYPSSVREIRFFTNLEKGFRFPALMIYLGTFLYWLMGICFTHPPRLLSRSKIDREEPVISTSNSIGGVEYSDAYLVEHDSRFVFQFIRRALTEECAAVNYIESQGSELKEDGHWITQVRDTQTGKEWSIRSRVVINACGPFVDRQNEISRQKGKHRHIFSKGIHLVVQRLTEIERVLTFFADDGRLFFAIPMGNRTVIGTTDNRVKDPETEVTKEDRQFVLDNINKRVKLKHPLEEKDIFAERWGVRPLVLETGQVDQNSDWTKLSRKHAIDVDTEKRHISIYGGKLTDCLNIGEELCAELSRMGITLPDPKKRWFGEPEPEKRLDFLNQAQKLGLNVPFHPNAYDTQAECLWRRYGEEAFELLEMIHHDSSLTAPIFPEAENLLCEMNLIAEQEMPVCLADLLRRRTRLSLLFHHDFLKNSEPLKKAASIVFGNQTEKNWEEYFS